MLRSVKLQDGDAILIIILIVSVILIVWLRSTTSAETIQVLGLTMMLFDLLCTLLRALRGPHADTCELSTGAPLLRQQRRE